MKGQIFVGLSGFSYPKWKGTFYPESLDSDKMLEYYASQFNSVEINSSFYRVPSTSSLKSWKGAVPQDFSFSFKANQRITHQKRLADVKQDVKTFMSQVRLLGSNLGPVLFQLPPYFKYNHNLLSDFLGHFTASDPKIAMEFRHESWFNNETYASLKQHGVALATVETEESAPVRKDTSDFAYLRLRKDSYTTKEIRDWAKKVEEIVETISPAFVYFKHDEKGTAAKHALDLKNLV